MQYCQVESNWLSQPSVCVVTEEIDNTVSTSEPLHSESSNPSSAEFPSDMARKKERYSELFGSDNESEEIPDRKFTASLDNTAFQQCDMQNQRPFGSLSGFASQTADFSVSQWIASLHRISDGGPVSSVHEVDVSDVQEDPSSCQPTMQHCGRLNEQPQKQYNTQQLLPNMWGGLPNPLAPGVPHRERISPGDANQVPIMSKVPNFTRAASDSSSLVADTEDAQFLIRPGADGELVTGPWSAQKRKATDDVTRAASGSKASSDSSEEDDPFDVPANMVCNTSPLVAPPKPSQCKRPRSSDGDNSLVFEEDAAEDHCQTPGADKQKRKQSDVSRMERTVVNSFDLGIMDHSNHEVYRGDRRRKGNRSHVLPTRLKYSERANKATSIFSMRVALSNECCKQHGKFQNTTMNIHTLSGLRHWYHKQLSSNQKQNLLTDLWGERLQRGTWEVKGLVLCYQGVCWALGISKGTLLGGRARALWGVMKMDNNLMRTRISNLTDSVRAWIDDFVKRYSEKMPHKSYLHLPACFTKSGLAELCRKDVKLRSKHEKFRSPSTRLFYAVWAEHFHHVTIPRLSDFSACNVCSKLMQRKLTKNLSDDAKLQLVADQQRKTCFHDSLFSQGCASLKFT